MLSRGKRSVGKNKQSVLEKRRLEAKRRAQKLAKAIQEKRLEYKKELASLQRELDAAGETVVKDASQFKRFENPFTVEKSCYDEDVFQINNPFCKVTLHNTTESMPLDKISDGKFMDEAPLLHAVDFLLEPVYETRSQYKNPHTELGARMIHASLLRNIHFLTRPTGSSLSTQDDQAGIEMSAGGKEVLRNRGEKVLSLHESDDILLAEGDEGLEEVLVLDKYDLKGKVHDLRLGNDNNLVTVLVVECDWSGEFTKIFQGSAHSMQAAISNMKKGRYAPIYIHAWCEGHWRYAVLYPRGIVTVKDNNSVEIERSSSSTIMTEQTLQERLLKSTASLKEWAGAPTAYPLKDYVLGDLHVCLEKMKLPINFKGEHLSVEGLLLIQSLIRIFVGDIALQFSVEDIDARIDERKRLGREEQSRFASTAKLVYQGMMVMMRKRRKIARSTETGWASPW